MFGLSASDCSIGVLDPFSSNFCSSVKNINMTIDSAFKFDKQVSSVIKTSFYQLRLLAKIKGYLPPKDPERVIHAFITTQLDYYNSLYFGIDQSLLHRLQLMQNAAARLLTGKHKRDHFTLVLALLRWLPVQFRIDFKI